MKHLLIGGFWNGHRMELPEPPIPVLKLTSGRLNEACEADELYYHAEIIRSGNIDYTVYRFEDSDRDIVKLLIEGFKERDP